VFDTTDARGNREDYRKKNYFCNRKIISVITQHGRVTISEKEEFISLTLYCCSVAGNGAVGPKVVAMLTSGNKWKRGDITSLIHHAH
jgi:hypothetical protein